MNKKELLDGIMSYLGPTSVATDCRIESKASLPTRQTFIVGI